MTLRVTHVLSDAWGGIASQVETLSRYQRKAGLDARVVQLCPEGPGTQRLRESGVPVATLSCKNGHDLRLPVQVLRILREWQPQVVHWHNRPSLGPVACHLYRAAHVTTMHGIIRSGGWLTLMPYRLFCFALRGVIAVSKSVLRDCEQEGLFPRSRRTVIPNCVDHTVYRRSDPPPAPAPDGRVVLIAVARLEADKRLSDAIEVLANLRRRGWDAHLWLVGEGSERQRLQELAQRLGVSDSVKFWGRVEHPASLLRQAHGFLVLSRYESFCLAALEAAACRIPVFAYRIPGGIQEWLGPGSGGTVSAANTPDSLAEEVNRVFRDRAAWIGLSERAWATAAQFSAVRVAAQTIRFYEECLRKRTS